MAKKKKSQLKSVSRGFATTSLPKKVALTELPSEVIHENATEVTEVETVVEDQITLSTSGGSPGAGRPEVQALVEKLQEKAEKAIQRTIKTIEGDRRHASTYPKIELDTMIESQVFRAIEEGWSSKVKPFYVNEDNEKCLLRLRVMSGVLSWLGYPEGNIFECLMNVSDVELEDSLDWMTVRSVETVELGKSVDQWSVPQTPSATGELYAASVPDIQAPLSVNDSNTPDEHASVEQGKKGSSATDNVAVQSLFTIPHDEVEDPNEHYVELKMQIRKLTGFRRRKDEAVSNETLRLLQTRLQAIQKHYFFNELEAEAAFLDAQREADQADLQSLPLVEPSMSVTSHLNLSDNAGNDDEMPKLNTRIAGGDVFDEGEDDDLGGQGVHLLGIFDDIPTSCDDIVVSIHDMPLPKNFTGRTPKAILQESVSRIDRKAVIVYKNLSGASRAQKACIVVQWGNGERNEWAMNDVACQNSRQAEQYIATVAMHALAYDQCQNYQRSRMLGTNGYAASRQLPLIFRDLWDELEQRRKEIKNQNDRAMWSTIQELFTKRLELAVKLPGQGAASQQRLLHDSQLINTCADIVQSTELRESYELRRSSPAYQAMQTSRSQLPITAFREQILKTIDQSQVTIISGETGCGKSTQVPSLILEDHLSRGSHCKIICTEPRRISAISLAQRVSLELGDPAGKVGTPTSLVGYSVRLESHVSRNNRLIYATNGTALRMFENGSRASNASSLFDEVTHVIVDEVHERSIESDFLLIVLKSLLTQQRSLKIILMSATVDGEKFSSYFDNCPVLKVPGRTFPVDVLYLEDAVEFTQWSISENSAYAIQPNDQYYRNSQRKPDSMEELAKDADSDDFGCRTGFLSMESRYRPSTISTINRLDERLIPYDLIIRILEKICFEDEAYFLMSAATLIFMPGLSEIGRMVDMLAGHTAFGTQAFSIHVLHSSIPSDQQGEVFKIPPPNVRKIVIATNIAETGITIPDITCVIDCGKHKEMRYDEKRHLSRLLETYIARSNAVQRRGRAGRVQPGVCFHLFTRVRHDSQMADHPLPEMMRLGLSDLALRTKVIKVNLGSSIEDVLSKALDPPSSVNIQRAVAALVEVQALTPSEDITVMGQMLAKLPMDVHLGKFLLIATLFGCLDMALTIAAVLNTKSPFTRPFGLEQNADRAKKSFQSDDSDFMTMNNVFVSWRETCMRSGSGWAFCQKNYLNHQTLQQVEELRQQFLTLLADASFIEIGQDGLRELNRAKFSRNRLSFVSTPEKYNNNAGDSSILHAALCAGLYPKLLAIETLDRHRMKTLGNNQEASIHPSSVNFGRHPSDFGVGFLSYYTIMQSKKLYAWETAPVDDLAVVLLCGDCEFKLASGTVIIDHKIKFTMQHRTCVALKYLRKHLTDIIATQIRGRSLSRVQKQWYELAMSVLAKPQVGQDYGAIPNTDGP